ncbi:MAG: ATP-dependent Lon protease [Methyloprofundus sp.]|nr:MAG: ATP-dependent Lon protease [Methyloprofundus sp.]
MTNLINQLLLLYEAESVVREPEMIITEWAIYDVIFFDGTQSSHLVGQVLVKGERVSSEIKQFFPERKTIITRSGRTYRLAGLPGTNYNGEVWENWKNVYQVVRCKDLTNEYSQKIRTVLN